MATILVNTKYRRKTELQHGDYVLLTISDTGTGIDPPIADRTFDPFSRLKGLDEMIRKALDKSDTMRK